MIYKCTKCNKDYFVSDSTHNTTHNNSDNNLTGVCVPCQISIEATEDKKEKTKKEKVKKEKVKKEKVKKEKTKKEEVIKEKTIKEKVNKYNPKVSLSTILLTISLVLIIIVTQAVPMLQRLYEEYTKTEESIHQDHLIDNLNQLYEKDDKFYYDRDLPEGSVIVENNIVVGFTPLNGDESIPQQIYIPEGVTEIADYAFKNYYGLVSVIFSNEVDRVGKYAFENCYNLEYVAINDKLTTIDDYAFFRLSLKRINLPRKLEYLGVSSLNYVSINDVILSEYAKLGSDCLDFTQYQSNGDAVIINNLFVKAPSNEKIDSHYIIPDNITSIEDYAFYSSNIEYVTIPEGVLYIGPRAFMLCEELKEVKFPATLIAIDTYAFYNCRALSKVEFNDELLAIGYQSFEGTNLESLDIPENTKVIENP